MPTGSRSPAMLKEDESLVQRGGYDAECLEAAARSGLFSGCSGHHRRVAYRVDHHRQPRGPAARLPDLPFSRPDSARTTLDFCMRGRNPMTKAISHKRPFSPVCPALRQINRLGVTKTPGKTFAVLAGFWHSKA